MFALGPGQLSGQRLSVHRLEFTSEDGQPALLCGSAAGPRPPMRPLLLHSGTGRSWRRPCIPPALRLGLARAGGAPVFGGEAFRPPRPASLALFESFASHVQNPFDLMIYAAVGAADLRLRLASARSDLAHVWRTHGRGERKPYSAEEETLLVEREAIMDLTLQARSASGPQCYLAAVDELRAAELDVTSPGLRDLVRRNLEGKLHQREVDAARALLKAPSRDAGSEGGVWSLLFVVLLLLKKKGGHHHHSRRVYSVYVI